MSYQNAYDGYHAVNLDTQTSRASPVELVLLLTDGLLDELARARAHIVARRYEQEAISIDKCLEIINGLSGSLDFEGGGLAQVLAREADFPADIVLCHDQDGGIARLLAAAGTLVIADPVATRVRSEAA